MSSTFNLVSPMTPGGDQPRAIAQLTERVRKGEKFSTLLGVTGSGKTFTMAHTIREIGLPALVLSHNKTLAAQLYAEFKELFPNNAVHYFVSYYDYYQPEAYIPQRDIYIEKDTAINEDIDRLRLATTSALVSRRDVIIVATVSSIYGLGSPEDYVGMIIELRKGQTLPMKSLFHKLIDIQYERNDVALTRGKFRVRGDTVEILPSYSQNVLRIEFFGDTIERIVETHAVSGADLAIYDARTIYPAKHFVTTEEKTQRAIAAIREELAARLKELQGGGKLLEYQRLNARTHYDLELLGEIGYCKGIENYSRHFSGRKPGERPYTLIDYFPEDFLTFVDESHVTLPQLRGMYNGDRSRKETLVEYGFRLPSALDNRPMRFDEWVATVKRVVFVSATPGPYEFEQCKGETIEQIIRPTGLIDPPIRVFPAKNQVAHLLGLIKERADRNERTLVTTLTKRLAEDLSTYMQEAGIKGKYLHSEIETIERVMILNELREGKFDVLVGVNLLREGLDLPEVSLVAILDADKEGFLRSTTSIIQTVGRTARHVRGEVVLYADRMTDSMAQAIAETDRRRERQIAWNTEHGITPVSISKSIKKGIEEIVRSQRIAADAAGLDLDEAERLEAITAMEKEMIEAAKKLQFERAAELRDAIARIRPGKPDREHVNKRRRR